ncbi:hypothetical protein ACM66B_005275 [Microbotryomycetes sp. NB124-2]
MSESSLSIASGEYARDGDDEEAPKRLRKIIVERVQGRHSRPSGMKAPLPDMTAIGGGSNARSRLASSSGPAERGCRAFGSAEAVEG